MTSVCLYFHAHQPHRVKRYRVFDIGNDSAYFSDESETDVNNRRVFEKVAQKSYLPGNKILLELLERHPEFRVSFSLSGVFLEQVEAFGPEVLESFKRLVRTGRVELVAETYYHSLASLYSRREFEDQINLHKEKLRSLFGAEPTTFRNTELIFSNDIARAAEDFGFKAILTEGADHVLRGRSPNGLYRASGSRIPVMLKNYKLSDDIAFRFGNKAWSEHPLSAEKFAEWVSEANGSGEVINLFMDYETLGEHQWEDTGIFEFLRAMPEAVLRNPDNDFVTPGEAAERYPARDEIDVVDPISWADIERDISAWLGNDLQKQATERLYELERPVKMSRNPALLSDWRRLSTSDHVYYMSTKHWADGDVHKYFSPYDSPYEAFIFFMNALHDVSLRV